MVKPIVFMYSGQGSQYYKMGKDLYESHSRFRLWMDHCDTIVRPMINTSIIEEIFHGGDKKDPFDNIVYTNPALLSFEYSLSRILMEMGVKPRYLLGYSLGEIAASTVSGAIALEDALRLVVDYANLVSDKCPMGGMLAILSKTSIIDEYPEAFSNCWLTGKNFSNHFVISGLADDITYLQSFLNSQSIISQRLSVNYAFHSKIMDPFEREFRKSISQINIFSPKIPMFSALTGKEITKLDDDFFWNVIRYPIDFERAINSMINGDDYLFIDAGPSGTLSTFVKYLLPKGSESNALETINHFGRDSLSIEKFRSRIASEALATA